MTDGIIQQVFNEYTVPNHRFFNYTNYEVRMIIDRLENELIERIKKEYERQYKYPMGITLKSLIGDSA